MTGLANEYREWILSRVRLMAHAIDGCRGEATDDEHIRITTPRAVTQINFYLLDEGEPEIVELRIAAPGDEDNPTFFLHFEMTDADHAHQLFDELSEALADANAQTVTRILLSCTSGLTTSFFARKLAEVAATLSLDYEFEALPIVQAMDAASDYDAVMLAPQVSMRRAEMVGRYPGKVVFEVPGRVFGSYDAGTALRMLLNAMNENALAARLERSSTRIVRKLDNDKLILVISGVFGTKDAVYGYRVYDHGEVALDGRVDKCRRDFRDVEDVFATVCMKGYPVREFDAIGIALPGVVDGATLRNVGSGYDGHDFSKLVDKAAADGIALLIDNNANAAAVGCYVSQDAYENIALHRQPTGYAIGGQGIIIDGRLVRGNHGLAGELGYLVHLLEGERGAGSLREALRELGWTSEGMRKLVATYLMCNIAAASPEAIYVAVDLLPEMDELSAELARWLPEGSVPELVAVDDYHERILVGEYALCLNALRLADAADE